MTVEKLKSNLEKLQALIPTKPEKYTPDFPLNIAEAFHKYLRTSALIQISSAAGIYEENGWPLPLFINPEKQRVGFKNSLVAKGWGIPINKANHMAIGIPALSDILHDRNKRVLNLNDSYIRLMNANVKGIKEYFLCSPLLRENTFPIENILYTYRKGKWAACISTIFPLIDLIIRKIFKTHKIDKNITYMVGLFKKAGFGFEEIDNLKPGRAVLKAIFRHFDTSPEEKAKGALSINDIGGKHKSYGLIGIALSSFLHFAFHYYSWYRNDKINANLLNRHAIIHGASNDYYTQANCVRLITFLYLTLELEPALIILLNEE